MSEQRKFVSAWTKPIMWTTLTLLLSGCAVSATGTETERAICRELKRSALDNLIADPGNADDDVVIGTANYLMDFQAVCEGSL